MGWGQLKVGEEGRQDKGQARGAEDGAGSVRVDDEARESAVLVGVPAMHLSAVQLDEDFIAHIQVQDDAVAGVVIVLVCVLGNGAGPDLPRENRTTPSRPVRSWGGERGRADKCSWACVSSWLQGLGWARRGQEIAELLRH